MWDSPSSCVELTGGSAHSPVVDPVDSLRPPPPKPPESGTMPGNHGLRLDDDQGFGPALPQPAEGNPEQPIEAIQFGPGLLPLEDGELLAKSDGFQGEFVMWQKKGAQVSAQARVTMVRS